MSVKEKLNYVIKEFNRLHGSEAQAEIKEIKGKEVIIEFKGTFCKTCGLYDYFDDIKWEALDFGIKIRPVEVLESEEDFEKGRYVVRYILEDQGRD
ncbi:hypothetical protein PFDSM3638_06205 [Pyrococcus furiosus DSM 3638]|uniref:Uncharacterized protein n=3 Tax=Pyrococcus furiosus TaxID=2261 RepID=Q8U1G5_PYRFU|nr:MULTISPECIES: hypothetical protein [Pyrococcus]AAL81367.1 hypothetical protein PF1243 [Pyrococcus furiosus DSM 3638]AFN04030.1 hypothetical protein PFC_05445 [Pyrococcus furiosus COM1]MDK2869150.1 hypothetical protein [Pyrococcus sp.]QEK78887.1 hypothetical protein PFDSM3638_06205 [Pyrococcus furiosus DSM 3638]